MKKLISVILCLSLLFSLGAFAAAEDVPQLAVVAYKDNTAWIGAAVAEDYVCFDVSVNQWTRFEGFELLITYNAAVLEYSEHYPFLVTEEVKNSINCTVTEPGKLCVIGTNDGCGTIFDPFCFKVIGEGDTDIAVELVSFTGADGEIENVVFETSIENFTAGQESAVLQLINDHATADGTRYSRFDLAVENCGALESFELIVHYNPAVLEYSSLYPFLQISVTLNSIDCTPIQPGQMRVVGTNDSDFLQDYKYLYMGFEPFCFKVIGEGDTDISVELVSFRTADGEVEDVVLDASIENFTATENDYVPVKQPEIYFYGDPPAVQYGVPNFETGMLIGMLLRGEIRNCANLERCEIAICFDPWVMEYTWQLPDGVGMDWESDGFVYSVSSQAKWLERDVYGVVIEIYRESAWNDGIVAHSVRTANADETATQNDVLQFRPLQFMVYNPGETEIYAKILSWTDTDGNTIEGNVTFSEGVKNAMSAEDYEAMTAMPSCMTGDAYYYYWTASENLTVAQLKESAPDTADVVVMNAEQSRALADDEIIGSGCRYCIVKNGETYFSKLLIVKNDIDGNGKITAEDARQALRFAVGLDLATDAQCRAAGVTVTNHFTAEIARTILRCSVGLEP